MKSFFISIAAPIVKLFPCWAMLYTLKSNPYAQKFQLSAKREIKLLENMSLLHTNEVNDRIWHKETLLYGFQSKRDNPELFQLMINCINNASLFDMAYKIAPEDALKTKGYTLDANRVVMACNDNVDYLYILVDKQPQSFTVEVVRKLNSKAKNAFFSYVFTKAMWNKLAEIDVVLFEEEKKCGAARGCLSFLLNQKNYLPNLSPEQLSTLGDNFKSWCEKADVFIVADKMAGYWKQNQDFEAIHLLLCRMFSTESSSIRNDKVRALLQMLPTDISYYRDDLSLALDSGIACPRAFKFLLDFNDDVNVNYNIALCIKQKIEVKISQADFERFNDKQKKKILIALAKDGLLSQELLAEVSDSSTKTELLNILEEKAQIKWFEPLLQRPIQDADVRILDNFYKLKKISGALQDLTFKNGDWVQKFVEMNWYDDKHIIALLQGSYIAHIRQYMKKYGLTQAQFEALLTSKNADLAPQAMLFLRKEQDNDAKANF